MTPTDSNLLNKPSAGTKGAGGVNLKIIILWIFGVISAFICGWFLKDFFADSSWHSLIAASVAAAVFLAIYTLETVFVEIASASAFIIFLESFALVIPFIVRSVTILSGGLVVFAILFIGNSIGRKIVGNQLVINFNQASSAILSRGIMAIALFAGFVVPFYLTSDKDQFPLPPSMFEGIVSSGTFFLDKILPGFTPTSTIEEIATNLATSKLNQIPGAAQLPASVRQRAIQDSVSGLSGQISSFFGVEINPKLTLGDALYEAARQRFLGLAVHNRDIVLAIIGVLAFLTIETFNWPIKIVISFFAFLIYEILLVTGFAAIELESRSKEVIVT